jgi:hypothetical protein
MAHRRLRDRIGANDDRTSASVDPVYLSCGCGFGVGKRAGGYCGRGWIANVRARRTQNSKREDAAIASEVVDLGDWKDAADRWRRAADAQPLGTAVAAEEERQPEGAGDR